MSRVPTSTVSVSPDGRVVEKIVYYLNEQELQEFRDYMKRHSTTSKKTTASSSSSSVSSSSSSSKKTSVLDARDFEPQRWSVVKENRLLSNLIKAELTRRIIKFCFPSGEWSAGTVTKYLNKTLYPAYEVALAKGVNPWSSAFIDKAIPRFFTDDGVRIGSVTEKIKKVLREINNNDYINIWTMITNVLPTENEMVVFRTKLNGVLAALADRSDSADSDESLGPDQ